MSRQGKAAADRLIANKRKLRARHGRPCPICDHKDWCIWDEGAALCPRSNGAGADGQYGEYGFLHLLGPQQIEQAYQRPQEPREKPDSELDRIFRPMIESAVAEGWGILDLLSRELTVGVESLEAVECGWSDKYGGAWVFPERNDAGLVVGISYRRRDGSKRQEVGGRRGLVYPDDWAERPGPVHIVEGATDTAAALHLGMAAIGRPSCTGGAKYLVPLLRRLGRSRRRVIVIGERDRKSHADLPERIRERHDVKCFGCSSCWPGKAGALSLAKQLRGNIRQPVSVEFPQGGAKDTRAYLKSLCTYDPDSA